MQYQLDAIIARLQAMPAFNIHSVDAETAAHRPWWNVTSGIVQDLVVREEYLRDQVQALPAQIAFWGRMTALTRRVWEIEEREYRHWRDGEVLKLSTPPKDDPKWKKPTEKTIEATYRSHREYKKWSIRVERAEEAFNSAQAILDGFKAKRDMLRIAAMSSRDGTQSDLRV